MNEIIKDLENVYHYVCFLMQKAPTPNAILAAILHDVLEDTKFESDVIEQKFGREVLAIVRELTQDKKLPRKERRELMILNSCKMSNEAKLIKLADREDNLNFHYMRKFSIQRQCDYCDESLALLEGLRDISAEIEERIMDRVKTIRELVG